MIDTPRGVPASIASRIRSPEGLHRRKVAFSRSGFGEPGPVRRKRRSVPATVWKRYCAIEVKKNKHLAARPPGAEAGLLGRGDRQSGRQDNRRERDGAGEGLWFLVSGSL
jgi:hypothetical protein